MDKGGRLLTGIFATTLQKLGDCIGKGAFGSVYKAFNWGTGEAVAVKQIKLADLPKSELRMIEVDPPPPSGPEKSTMQCGWQRVALMRYLDRPRSTSSRTCTMTTSSNTSAPSSPWTASTSSSSTARMAPYTRSARHTANFQRTSSAST